MLENKKTNRKLLTRWKELTKNQKLLRILFAIILTVATFNPGTLFLIYWFACMPIFDDTFAPYTYGEMFFSLLLLTILVFTYTISMCELITITKKRYYLIPTALAFCIGLVAIIIG